MLEGKTRKGLLSATASRGLIMKTRTYVLAAATAAVLALSGCANNAQLGTGAGAVAGGVVGDAVFGSTLGVVGGAAAGALLGNEVGKRSDQRR